VASVRQPRLLRLVFSISDWTTAAYGPSPNTALIVAASAVGGGPEMAETPTNRRF
jgi:hypothetical protein